MSTHVLNLMSLLGGPAILGTRPDSSGDWHSLIRHGVPVESAQALKKSLDLSDPVLAELLGVSEKTLSRARHSGADLDPTASDRLFRVARVAALAYEVLESQPAALNWLKRPQVGLGNQVPVSLLTTSAGTEEVERLLLRIEHGVYS
ncbi:MAG: antitoxin Xre-like helix-turn-helix domain-containing protein [Bryobacteraceae bacterium]|nr:antitoxin Xre-like helix-turn-helix domain-containing protein [Bryobacteraceae bacterium]